MKIRWSPEAAEELEQIWAWFEPRSVRAAQSVIKTIYRHVRELKQFPRRGRPGSKPGTRELVIPLVATIIYRISDGAIEILRVRHGSQSR